MRVVSLVLLFSCVIQFTYTYQLYCRCDCNENSIITAIEKCGLCTKEYCLKTDKDLCIRKKDKDTKQQEQQPKAKDDNHSSDSKEDKEKEEANIIISCFQVESFKESTIIYSFLLLVSGLLLYALFLTFYYK